MSHPKEERVTREEATEIAKLAALNRGMSNTPEHSYLPRTREEAETWAPHEWVVDAIVMAANARLRP